MEFRILGPVEVWDQGRWLALGGSKPRAVLGVLLLEAGRVVSIERLIDELWDGDPPRGARNTVQRHVSHLRHVLERDGGAVPGQVLVTRPPGYLLRVEPDQVDLCRFERLTAQARAALGAGEPEQAAGMLREALALWRGPALADVAEPVRWTAGARLEEARLAALAERIEADLTLGRHDDLVGELTAVVAAHPLRERLRGQLMVALYRAGRQAEALAVYHEGRQTLAEQLGLDPGPQLRELEHKILTGDPELLLPPPPTRPPPDIADVTGRAKPAQVEQSAPGLIRTKLQSPVSRRRVSRRALVELLCAGGPRKLTLIRAPAGSGKTTLLADWHACERETRPFAWLALDRGDNDPVRFWTYLIEALRTLDPELGVNSLPLLRAPGVSLVTGVLPVLINELVTSPRPSVLVLDDYHLIDNAAIDDGIAFLIEHLPQTLELVIATRCEPALPLARLRVRGESAEIDAEALRFSRDEADALLNDLHGLGLGRDEVARLCERTEGWAAGLYLATLTLRGRDNAHELIGALAGDHRHIVDYLGGEVLAGQPDEVRDFLLRTSILDRLCAPLCDAVTGMAGCAGMLADLERSNFFLVPLDFNRRWYRYHHLFGELLRRELNLAEADQVPTLHRRAGAWHLQAGFVAEAIGHIITAGDLADAAELIARHWNDFVQSGKAGTVDGWLVALGDSTLLGDARMCLVRAWTSFAMGRLDEVLGWTEAAEAAPLPAPLRDGTASVAAGAATLRAAYWLLVGHLGRVRRFAVEAIELQQTPGWRANATNCAGMASYWLGDIAAAVAQLEQTVRHTEEMPLLAIYALGHLAMIHAERAEWDRAAERASTALGLGDAHGVGEYWMNAMVHIARAKILQHRGRLADAEGALVRGLALARRGSIPMDLAYGLMTLAQVRHGLEDHQGAQVLLAEARDTVEACLDAGLLPDMVESVSGRLSGMSPSRVTAAPSGELNGRELAGFACSLPS